MSIQARRTLHMTLFGPFSRLGLGVASAAIAVDQLHKAWMLDIFEIGRNGKIEIAPFFDLVLVWNRGVSYGLFKQENGLGQWMLIALAFIAALALAVWLASQRGKLPAAAIGLIIGGALANAIDRIRFGAVADFFSFHAGGFYWYVFNLADVAIVAGVLGLLYDWLKSSHKEVENKI